jgi:tetratricopeptide (TPR) repeat protein
MATVAEAFALAWRHYQAGAFAEAERLYRQIVRGTDARLASVHAQAHFNLGVVVAQQGKIDEAISHYRQAQRLNPESVETHNNLANVLRQRGQVDEAMSCYRQALRCRPDSAETYNNLGIALTELGKFDEATSCYRDALRINPHSAEANNNLGEALKRMGRLEEAIDFFHQALRVNPHFAEAHNSLGDAQKQLGQFDEALSSFERAIQLNASFAGAQWNRALMWLLLGDFQRGWPAYEWRWTQPTFERRHAHRPLWDGMPFPGRALLLHAEQGLGDTLLLIRYVSHVCRQRKLGSSIIVECQPALCRLLANLPGVDQLVAIDAPLPHFDLQVPLASLPGILAISPAATAATVPYLSADSKLMDHWKRKLRSVRGFKVGIAWQGNPSYGHDRQRSIALTHFAELAKIEGIHLVSLQKGPGTEQLHSFPAAIHVIEFDEASGPFMDTAAIMKSIDLVIASDSAVAHLAGALAVPVWVALPAVPDWRWLLKREDSPWYPTMRLFRQPRVGNWDDVFERIAVELKIIASESD